jgi:exonuclease SbcC
MGLRFVHFADLHFSAKNQDRAIKALEVISTHIREHDIKTVLFSGDFFDGPVEVGDNSGYSAMLAAVAEILNQASVYAVSGTPSHDPPGAYAPFELLNSKRSWKMLQPGLRGKLLAEKVLILGAPEVRMGQLLSVVKDGTKEELVGAYRDIFKGQGVEAAKLKAKGWKVLYLWHGHLQGATLQNQTILTGGLRVGHQDLALVGADYYALGDLHFGHKPFQGLPAVYSGSCFPVDWGELDEKTFVDIELWDDGHSAATRVSFGFSHREKIVWPTEIPLLAKGTHVWLHLNNEDDKVDAIGRIAGAGGDIKRITLEPPAHQEARAPEVATAPTLLAKLQAADYDITGFLAAKAAELELKASQEGVGTEQREWELKAVTIFGSLGVKDTVLHEIPEDLIAVVGATGAGKTTLMENICPWPRMLTRGGSLSKHFSPGGGRTIFYRDNLTGEDWRFTLKINASVERYAHMSRGSVTDWVLQAEGSPAYDQLVDRLFGGISLYVRSVFIPQKPTKALPLLTDCTQAERKEMLAELCGLERYDWWRAYATGARVGTESDVGDAEDVMVLLEDALGRRRELVKRYTPLAQDLRRATKAVPVLRKAARDTLAVEQDLAFRAQEVSVHKKEAVSCDLALKEATEQMGVASRKRKALKAPRWDEQHITQQLEGLHKAQANLAMAKENYSETLLARQVEIEASKDRIGVAEEEVDRIERLANKVGEKIVGNSSTTALVRSSLNNAKEKLADDLDHCRTCGQILPDKQLAAARREQGLTLRQIEAYQDEINVLEEKRAALDVKRDTFADALKAVEVPGLEEPPMPDRQDMVDLGYQLDNFDSETDLKNQLKLVREGAERLKAAESTIAQLMVKRSMLKDQMDEHLAKVDDQVVQFHENSLADLERKNQAHEDGRVLVRSLEDQQGKLDRDKKELNATIDEYLPRREAHRLLVQDVKEWAYLEEALGPNGLPALEIDAKGPAVAAVANQLLAAAYGDRFRIEFETQRESSDGKKLIEDFRIWIYDTEGGDRKLLEMLSGGEEALILRAIHDAFAKVRADNGLSFLTSVNDEIDGAMDVESRIAFLGMLRESHRLLGRKHTFVITHSPELQGRIEEKIQL